MSRVVIVGGVAGGATAAARIKRLSAKHAVTMIERSPDISFANCGLPYFIGREIQDASRLALQTPKSFSDALGVDVRTETTVTAIDVKKKVIVAKPNRLGGGDEVVLPYDKLILSPGASPVRPALPGIDDPRIMTLRNLQDMYAMDSLIQKPSTRRVVVVGAGFIGLEMVEQLVHAGKDVSLVELNRAVLPQADAEMAEFLHAPMVEKGVKLHLNDNVASFDANGGQALRVKLGSGTVIEADAVVLCVGVKPESSLAKDAGLQLAPRGQICVNPFMQTSDPDVYAVGDAIETSDMVFPEKRAWTCLGNVANMQARIAADHLVHGASIPYKGSLGTSIVRCFDYTLAVTGWNEKRLLAESIPFQKTVITSDHHAGYYPGATPITLKILFDPNTGRIFGGQAVGVNGVDKRIDVVATAIQGGLTIDDVSQTQLTYSPPFGSARDTVNVAALAARNIKEGLVKPTFSLAQPKERVVIDVRPAENASLAPVPGATNIPFAQLKAKAASMDPKVAYTTVCALGKTSYFAARAMEEAGLNVNSVVGGLRLHRKPAGVPPAAAAVTPTTQDTTTTSSIKPVVSLDCTGLACPGPLLKLRGALDSLPEGSTLRVTATDPGFANDVRAFASAQGLTVLSVATKGGVVTGELARNATGAASSAVAAGGATGSRPGATIVVFSQDMDKVLAAFVIANGARAMGGDVTLFFTFWGLNALRKPDGRAAKAKPFMDAMFGWMMPKGKDKLPISNMNFAGMGPKLLRHQMGAKGLPTLEGLMKSAKEQNVRIVACTMSMDAMGIGKEELVSGVELGGVADYLAASSKTGTNLFI